MSNDSLLDTIKAKSDQLNADDLISGAITCKITKVSRCAGDQPIAVYLEGDHQPFKPCKTMRRVLIAAWGEYGHNWVGKSLTLFNDPEVMYGGVKVGGIRISHLSDIDSDMTLSLNTTRGKKKPYFVKKLVAKQKPFYDQAKFDSEFEKMAAAIESGKSTHAKIIAHLEKTGKITQDQLDAIYAIKLQADAQTNETNETTQTQGGIE